MYSIELVNKVKNYVQKTVPPVKPSEIADHFNVSFNEAHKALRYIAAINGEGYFSTMCECRVLYILSDGTAFLGGIDDCPVHGFGEATV